MTARKHLTPDTGYEASPSPCSVSQPPAASFRRQLYRRLLALIGMQGAIGYLRTAAGLGLLHMRSRHMKLKLQMLERRYLAMRRERERFGQPAAIHAAAPPPTEITATVRRHGPIWLHGSWRTGSTYVWHKFRADTRYLAYYEPFHENLEHLTAENIGGARHDTWNSHHPDVGAPYFQEYRELIHHIGVRHFVPALPYRNFFTNGDPLPEQRAYLDALVGHAERQGRRPVFGFCRSWGRTAWFRRYAPPGVHIVLTRDPLSLWRSAQERHRRYGDVYFLTMPLVSLVLAEHEPWLAHYLRVMGLDHIGRDVDLARAQRHAAGLLKTDPDAIMRAFVAAQGLALTMALCHADVVMPIEDLACAMRRRALHDTLSSRYDIHLDWSDCRIPVWEPRTEDKAFLAAWSQARTEAEHTLERYMAPILPPWPHPIAASGTG
ncbi:MAG: hypothetical protein M0Z76_00610 [Gammaproteobacteria bacterium]|nr:hypothetical protein [Gammaproteobacteria bacterium]